MIQQEFFKKTQTDNLLRHRYAKTCAYPKKEGDTPDYNNDSGLSWYIDKELLYKELETRPHRIRAKDRRKVNRNH
tara:strand:- start:479 stop:703 length:225 start_codon:yes stop_codon:yes gene_type:complete